MTHAHHQRPKVQKGTWTDKLLTLGWDQPSTKHDMDDYLDDKAQHTYTVLESERSREARPPGPALGLCRLPHELILQILEHVAASIVASSSSSSPSSPSQPPTTPATLSALARTCQRLNSIVPPVLYRCAVALDLLQTTYIAARFHTTPQCHRRHWPLLFPSPQARHNHGVGDPAGHDRQLQAGSSNNLQHEVGSSSGPGSGTAAALEASGGDTALSSASSSCYTTALHVASQHGHLATVGLLLDILGSHQTWPAIVSSRSAISDDDDDDDNNDNNNNNNNNKHHHNKHNKHQQGDKEGERNERGGHPNHPCLPPCSSPTDATSLAPLLVGTASTAAGLPLADALDATAPLACLCPSRHLHFLLSTWLSGLAPAAGRLSVPRPYDWPLATPLMLAVAHGHGGVARLLVASGASWCVPPVPGDLCGVTPLHMAVANGMVDLVEWLASFCSSSAGPGLGTDDDDDDDDNNSTGATCAAGCGRGGGARRQEGCCRPGDGHGDGAAAMSRAPWHPNAVFTDWPDQDGRSAFHYVSLCNRPSALASALASASTAKEDEVEDDYSSSSSCSSANAPSRPPLALSEVRRLIQALLALGADPGGGCGAASARVDANLRLQHLGRRAIGHLANGSASPSPTSSNTTTRLGEISEDQRQHQHQLARGTRRVALLERDLGEAQGHLRDMADDGAGDEELCPAWLALAHGDAELATELQALSSQTRGPDIEETYS
ncbi:putative ankyrin unc44 [Diaporthe ampelina]|uniref:Putative ankyrin unc44 n=1 Tax=Diaporthe ampelina TaxID=1214573 RepID=A0A0G2F879_9PEZI|nr:putative ankyrin unc44 [Diaporthe ampelina]